MKATHLYLFFLLVAGASQAQSGGIISYEEKVKLQIHLDGPGNEELLNSLPKERSSKYTLWFNEEASYYKGEKPVEQTRDVEQTSEDEGGVIVKIQQADDQVYCDLKNNQRIEHRDFMSRQFLVESEMSSMKWKLTGNQKTILGFPCQEAELSDTSKKVIAWFTSKIPISSGPNGYGNLPGMILALDIDQGRASITATNVSMQPVDNKLMIKPKDGKKVSRKEFDKIVSDKRKEMEEENGSGGNVIIRIKN